jgi:hypothetical protein
MAYTFVWSQKVCCGFTNNSCWCFNFVEAFSASLKRLNPCVNRVHFLMKGKKNLQDHDRYEIHAPYTLFGDNRDDRVPGVQVFLLSRIRHSDEYNPAITPDCCSNASKTYFLQCCKFSLQIIRNWNERI